jgi:hypothetical protein
MILGIGLGIVQYHLVPFPKRGIDTRRIKKKRAKCLAPSIWPVFSFDYSGAAITNLCVRRPVHHRRLGRHRVRRQGRVLHGAWPG